MANSGMKSKFSQYNAEQLLDAEVRAWEMVQNRLFLGPDDQFFELSEVPESELDTIKTAEEYAIFEAIYSRKFELKIRNERGLPQVSILNLEFCHSLIMSLHYNPKGFLVKKSSSSFPTAANQSSCSHGPPSGSVRQFTAPVPATHSKPLGSGVHSVSGSNGWPFENWGQVPQSSNRPPLHPSPRPASSQPVLPVACNRNYRGGSHGEAFQEEEEEDLNPGELHTSSSLSSSSSFRSRREMTKLDQMQKTIQHVVSDLRELQKTDDSVGYMRNQKREVQEWSQYFDAVKQEATENFAQMMHPLTGCWENSDLHCMHEIA